MKNENEYVNGEKRFIKNIRKCNCIEKKGDLYILKCSIIQRGDYDYKFTPGIDFISKEGNTKGFWLSENAKLQVNSAVQALETIIDKAKLYDIENNYVTDDKFTVHYEHRPNGNYECLLSYTDITNVLHNYYFDSSPIDEIIHFTAWPTIDYDIYEQLKHSTVDTIENNPFYIAATRKNDKLLQNQIKVYYNIATEEECWWLSKELGVKVLPSLSQSFDKPFVVDTATISVKVLRDSGYVILHRPYFAMKDSTHSKWQLNSHTKRGVDASPVNCESIPFDDYVKIIESNQKHY